MVFNLLKLTAEVDLFNTLGENSLNWISFPLGGYIAVIASDWKYNKVFTAYIRAYIVIL